MIDANTFAAARSVASHSGNKAESKERRANQKELKENVITESVRDVAAAIREDTVEMKKLETLRLILKARRFGIDFDSLMEL